MEHPKLSRDTPAWIFQVWASFVISMVATALGVVYLPAPPWVKAFLGMGLFFTVASTFTLAKTIRDNHESSKLVNRVAEANVERIIRDHDAEATL